MVCGHARSAGAAATGTVLKKMQSSAYRDAAINSKPPGLLFPLVADLVFACAGGDTPEYR